jgi:hypothetical protein
MTAAETPAQFLRRAAEHLRGLANDASDGQKDWTWFSGPILDPAPFDFTSRVNAKRPTERGEEWTCVADTHPHVADYIAAMHPDAVAAIADSWGAVADEMEGYLVVTPDALKGDAVWTTTYNAARVLLGETDADAPALPAPTSESSDDQH